MVVSASETLSKCSPTDSHSHFLQYHLHTYGACFTDKHEHHPHAFIVMHTIKHTLIWSSKHSYTPTHPQTIVEIADNWSNAHTAVETCT